MCNLLSVVSHAVLLAEAARIIGILAMLIALMFYLRARLEFCNLHSLRSTALLVGMAYCRPVQNESS